MHSISVASSGNRRSANGPPGDRSEWWPAHRLKDYSATGSAVLPTIYRFEKVYLAEVVAKLQERGMPDDRIRANIEALEFEIEPFGDILAIEAGLLRSITRKAGLSLGDRACLALAK
jgi:PIN domain nuclease of toxin-antitoxin system